MGDRVAWIINRALGAFLGIVHLLTIASAGVQSQPDLACLTPLASFCMSVSTWSADLDFTPFWIGCKTLGLVRQNGVSE